LVEVSVNALVNHVNVIWSGKVIGSGAPVSRLLSFYRDMFKDVPAGQTVTNSLLAIGTDSLGFNGQDIKPLTIDNSTVTDLAISDVSATPVQA